MFANHVYPFVSSPSQKDVAGSQSPGSRCPLFHADPFCPCMQHLRPKEKERANRVLKPESKSLQIYPDPSQPKDRFPQPSLPTHLLKQHKFILQGSSLVDFIFIPVIQGSLRPAQPVLSFRRWAHLTPSFSHQPETNLGNSSLMKSTNEDTGMVSLFKPFLPLFEERTPNLHNIVALWDCHPFGSEPLEPLPDRTTVPTVVNLCLHFQQHAVI